MALEIFALLDLNGDPVQTAHIFTGSKRDVSCVATVLDEVFSENKRLRSVAALAARFHDGSQLSIPVVRLNKQECRVLVDGLDDYTKNKPKTTIARKLSNQLSKMLCVY